MKQSRSEPRALDPREKAHQTALRLLSHRARSEAELQAHLARRGYSTVIVARTIEKLRSLNYVNDEAYARNFALATSENRSYGPKRIERELRAKGIDQALIRDVVRETFARADETAKARMLLKKRFKDEKFDDPKMLRRAAAFLQRRGYSSNVIFDLLKVSVEDD